MRSGLIGMLAVAALLGRSTIEAQDPCEVRSVFDRSALDSIGTGMDSVTVPGLVTITCELGFDTGPPVAADSVWARALNPDTLFAAVTWDPAPWPTDTMRVCARTIAGQPRGCAPGTPAVWLSGRADQPVTFPLIRRGADETVNISITSRARPEDPSEHLIGSIIVPALTGPVTPPPDSTPPVTGPGIAELPRDSIRRLEPSSFADTVRVAAGGDLQAALNGASSGGRLILLDRAGTWTGVRLPVRSGAWVQLTCDGCAGAAYGDSVRIIQATGWPTIRSASSRPALDGKGPADDYWLGPFLNVIQPPGLFVDAIVRLEGTRLEVDRIRVAGNNDRDAGTKRCINATRSSYLEVIGSQLHGCNKRGQDAQAILVAYSDDRDGDGVGDGVFRFHRNGLSGSGEVWLFGGSVPPGGDHRLAAADIEITENTHYWTAAELAGPFAFKNQGETKLARRVLIDRNTFAGFRGRAQDWVLVWKGVHGQGTDALRCPGCSTTDITFTNNLITDSDAGMQFCGFCGGSQAPVERTSVRGNTFELVPGGRGTCFFFPGRQRDIEITDNVCRGRGVIVWLMLDHGSEDLNCTRPNGSSCYAHRPGALDPRACGVRIERNSASSVRVAGRGGTDRAHHLEMPGCTYVDELPTLIP